MTAERPGVPCPCGGRIIVVNEREHPRRYACPRCGRTPLDLVRREGT